MLKPGGVFVTSTVCLGDTMKFFKLIGPVGRFLGLMPLVKVFTIADLMHFATHVHLDNRFPLDSAVILAAGGGPARADVDDGNLRAWEVFESVRIGAELVTLSGCESGLGRVARPRTDAIQTSQPCYPPAVRDSGSGRGWRCSTSRGSARSLDSTSPAPCWGAAGIGRPAIWSAPP